MVLAAAMNSASAEHQTHTQKNEHRTPSPYWNGTLAYFSYQKS